jgi:hypothetical protein
VVPDKIFLVVNAGKAVPVPGDPSLRVPEVRFRVPVLAI